MELNNRSKLIGTRVEIDLDLLQHNFMGLKQTVDEKVLIAGVVKANAYGHDLHTISQALVALECNYLMVANLREALSIRKYFSKMDINADFPIMVMGVTNSVDFEKAIEGNITMTIFSIEAAETISEIAQKMHLKAKVHVKIDTGFNRLGYKDHLRAVDEIEAMMTLKGLEVEGIFSHLALKDEVSDYLQFEKFEAVLDQLKNRGIEIPIKHICDSIGAIAYPEKRYDMVRMGALLYGYCSRPTPFELLPIMRFVTNITEVKWLESGEGISYDYLFVAEQRTKVATIPVGYADGLPRALSKEGYVIVNGHKAPIVGLMCMDQCMIDITNVPEGNIGDEVILFDKTHLSLSSMAALAKTNRNELLSRIAMRVIRIFIKNDRVYKVVDYLD